MKINYGAVFLSWCVVGGGLIMIRDFDYSYDELSYDISLISVIVWAVWSFIIYAKYTEEGSK